MDKQKLRYQMRQCRDALTDDVRQHESSKIIQHVLDDKSLLKARRVAIYDAFGSEVATWGLFMALQGRGIDVYYPRIVYPQRHLTFVHVGSFSELLPTTWGGKEPEGQGVAVDVMDIICLPGLAFDSCGGRLGYGHGCYDRTLAGSKVPTIGVGFRCQFVAQVPMLNHDHRLDAVVSGDGLIWCDAI